MMLSFLTGMMFITLPCNIQWSILNDNTVFVFKNKNYTDFCFENIKVDQLKNAEYGNCISFQEQIIPETIFEHDKILYLVARSVLDNSSLFFINDTEKMTIFSYQRGILRYNTFTNTLFLYSKNYLYEYDVKNLIYHLLRKSFAPPLKIIKTKEMEDFYFPDKNTILFLSKGDVYFNESYLMQSNCLPYYSPHPILPKVLCFISILCLFIFVFMGTPLTNVIFKKR